MLVLSRKKNEAIVIGDNVTVTVIEIRGEKVRLGISAPSTVPVHRQEVYNNIHGIKPIEEVPILPAGETHEAPTQSSAPIEQAAG